MRKKSHCDSKANLWRLPQTLDHKWLGTPDSLLHPELGLIEYNRDRGLEEPLANGNTKGEAWFPKLEQIDRLPTVSTAAEERFPSRTNKRSTII
jgi:hypothetical protein